MHVRIVQHVLSVATVLNSIERRFEQSTVLPRHKAVGQKPSVVVEHVAVPQHSPLRHMLDQLPRNVMHVRVAHSGQLPLVLARDRIGDRHHLHCETHTLPANFARHGRRIQIKLRHRSGKIHAPALRYPDCSRLLVRLLLVAQNVAPHHALEKLPTLVRTHEYGRTPERISMPYTLLKCMRWV